MKRRLILLAIVMLGLAPGTLVRDAPRGPDLRAILHVEPLEISGTLGEGIVIEGVWKLTSPNEYFGGFSGLAAIGDDELLAVSDMGGWMRFPMPGSAGEPSFGPLPRANERNKSAVDAEGLTDDPATGQLWVAYEKLNTIERSDLAFQNRKLAEPASMADWPSNRGAEAMARLVDGRFLVIGETAPGWTGNGFPALLFDRDPVEDREPISFEFTAPSGFRATAVAPLPDGRALILLRSVEAYFPPRFGAKLALADPAVIEEGEEWSGEIIATFGEDLPRDNFEGLAVVPRDDGSVTLWLISDDNGMMLQRTLLYRLRLDLDAHSQD